MHGVPIRGLHSAKFLSGRLKQANLAPAGAHSSKKEKGTGVARPATGVAWTLDGSGAKESMISAWVIQAAHPGSRQTGSSKQAS